MATVQYAGLLAFVAGCSFSSGFVSGDAAPDAPTPGRWAQLATNNSHACALDLDHALYCWGDNLYGQNGTGATDSEVPQPTRVGTATWTALAAGTYHVCGIQTDGSLWCWGRNDSGQLGVDETAGAVATASTPIRVAAQATFVAVAAGYEHTCAIAADQSLSCWGENTYGQFGNGAAAGAGSRVPVQVSTNMYISVAAGAYSTYAIASDHSLVAAGYNYYGEIGVGTNTSANTFQPILGTWDQIASENVSACGVTSDHHLRCWGWNARGALGDGSTTDRTSPEAVGDDRGDWATVATGGTHTCATRMDGSLWCWGDDSRGQLALSDLRAVANPTPTLVADVTGVTAVAAGAAHSCAITANHDLVCTGAAALGVLADGTRSRREPTQLAGGWTRVTSGAYSTCATRGDGSLACWGDNSYGELGDGRAVPENAPASTTLAAPSVIAAGVVHACSIDAAKQVWCWGYPSNGETGDPASQRSAPAPLTGVTATAMSARDHTCAIPTSPDTGLWCWGNNLAGQLGTGALGQTNMPVHVLTAATWSAVAAGGDAQAAGVGHTCGISGTALACWGYNDYGQIGNGAPVAASVLVPSAIPGAWTAVALGGRFSCAIAQGGQAACWGQNTTGQLGIGSKTSSAVPASVGAATWKQLSAATAHVCGIQTDGSLWCWGLNDRGQLGDGTNTERDSPVQIGTATTWAAVAAGDHHTCALRTDQTLWCWGLNSSGQLGDGSAWRAAWRALPDPP